MIISVVRYQNLPHHRPFPIIPTSNQYPQYQASNRYFYITPHSINPPHRPIIPFSRSTISGLRLRPSAPLLARSSRLYSSSSNRITSGHSGQGTISTSFSTPYARDNSIQARPRHYAPLNHCQPLARGQLVLARHIYTSQRDDKAFSSTHLSSTGIQRRTMTTAATTPAPASAISAFPEIQALFDNNKKWAEHVCEEDDTFFPKSTKGQVSISLTRYQYCSLITCSSNPFGTLSFLLLQPIMFLQFRMILGPWVLVDRMCGLSSARECRDELQAWRCLCSCEWTWL